MTFRDLTKELSKMFHVVPGVTPYAESLWPEMLHVEGSQA
jgi:hypothetical protein